MYALLHTILLQDQIQNLFTLPVPVISFVLCILENFIILSVYLLYKKNKVVESPPPTPLFIKFILKFIHKLSFKTIHQAFLANYTFSALCIYLHSTAFSFRSKLSIPLEGGVFVSLSWELGCVVHSLVSAFIHISIKKTKNS